MKIKHILVALTAVGALVSTVPARAAVEVLNFAGLDGNDEESILNYYDGGFGGLGSGPGPSYGITFPNSAIIVCAAYVCNTSNIPGGAGANVMFSTSATDSVMDVAGGFTSGFSFYYSAPVYTGSVTVYSGPDDTGSVLATLPLALTPYEGGTCDTVYCPYEPVGVTFSGTAESVDFSGAANYIGFADITVGSQNAGGTPTPEPASFAILGAGLLGLGAFRRLRK